MRNTIGFLLQMTALVMLPCMLIWQLDFGMKLLWMPTMTLVGLCLFYLGHWMRGTS